MRPAFLPELSEVYQRLLAHFGHRSWWPGDTQIEIIVGAILTQNTAWTNVEKAIVNLKREKALAVGRLREMELGVLAGLIRPSGYFNQKARKIKAFIEFLDRSYQGSIARMGKAPVSVLRPQLLEVHGIGPETADSILLYALGKPVFVVDAYTRRIFYRHIFFEKVPTYEQVQGKFHRELPQDVNLYNDFHAQIVAVGNRFCKPRPKCEGCPLESLPHHTE